MDQAGTNENIDPISVKQALETLANAFGTKDTRSKDNDKWRDVITQKVDRLSERVDILNEQVAILTGRLQALSPEWDATPLELETQKRIERLAPKAVQEARELLPGALTIAETAKGLGCTTKTVYAYIDRGLLDARKIGSRRMVTRESYDALVTDRKRGEHHRD